MSPTQSTQKDTAAKVKPIPPEIEDYLSYDFETGAVTWKAQPARKVAAGSEAGSVDRKGYLGVQFRGSRYQLHRVIWFLHYGEDPAGLQIDHINRDRADNRIDNLRLVSQQQNSQNTAALGVYFNNNEGKWKSHIMVAGKNYHLGTYDCPVLAGLAYLNVKSVIHPKSNAS